MKNRIKNSWPGLFLAIISPVLSAQLVVTDDIFGVPVFQVLEVESPGVLKNDIYNAEPAEDGGATVVLLSGPASGTLTCLTDAGLELCPDGSFNYTPNVDFSGSDSFTYQVTVDTETDIATATLSACSVGPIVFVCWKESEYLSKLDSLGFGILTEGFEDPLAWASARSPLSATSVVSQGIAWESNHPLPPASNQITTGPGPALTGDWAIFDMEHGYATGSVDQCDIDNPPEHCHQKDGFTGTMQAGESILYAAGGFFTGQARPKLVMILDGGAAVPMGSVENVHQFYGVIQTLGFSRFRVEETDGKIGQERHVFADDFTFATESQEIFSDSFE
jgi:hypothetical protein